MEVEGAICADIGELPFRPQLWLIGEERLSLHFVSDNHNPAVQAPVKQFATIGGPNGNHTASGRDRHFSAGSRKRPHVDLKGSGFIRVISEPMAIRGKGRFGLNEWSCKKCGRLSGFPTRRLISFHRENHDIGSRQTHCTFLKGQELSTRVPGSWPLIVLALREALRFPALVCTQPIYAVGSTGLIPAE